MIHKKTEIMETLDCVSGCCYLRWIQKNRNKVRKATVKL